MSSKPKKSVYYGYGRQIKAIWIYSQSKKNYIQNDYFVWVFTEKKKRVEEHPS